MKKAVIFARVSSVSDRQSTERQVNDLQKYSDYSGMNIERTFEEKISGGKKNGDRPMLCECIEYCINNKIDCLLVSELSRLGRNAFEVLETVKRLIDSKVNIYMQKEQFLLLDDKGNPSLFAPVMIATLSTCAQLERDNIKFRLNSGRAAYIAKGGRLGRKTGSFMTTEKKKEKYAKVILLLKKGTAIRNVAKITGCGISTVQRVKKEFGI